MEEALYQNFKIGLLLSKLNQPLSEAEAIESCKIYFEIKSIEKINNLMILTISPLPNATKHDEKISSDQTIISDTKFSNHPIFKEIKVWLNRLAFSKEAYLIIGEPQNQFEKMKNEKTETKISWEPYFKPLTSNFLKKQIESENNKKQQKSKNFTTTPTFKISIRNITSSDGKRSEPTISIKTLGKELANKNFTNVTMTNPAFEFTILNAEKEFIGIKLWENLEEFEERRAHLRPVLHPTAINPRLGRAMINLAGAKKEVFDPFCGAGGTLLEAITCGLIATGTDIDPLMIKRAELNLKNEIVKLIEMDALNWNEKIECIVTDLPYGKSSKLELELNDLILKFLNHYSSLTDKIVFCFLDGTLFEIPKPWSVKYEFKIYIHKSMTRRIVVLEKK
ncbi:MAG: hypothetical protein WC758_06325 [Candidatus Woesearchaeota archaeon]|jgi:tRNA (guanine10-N2)-dimethyltransferase